MRIGHGYDIHRFEENSTQSSIRLGGVEIPCKKGLLAHSDGDVVIHAICDALLGALALGDIGEYFPDTSEKYKNIDSRELLKDVMTRVKAQGYTVKNIDVTILAQMPKITPHKNRMRENLASDLMISMNDINIKATTHEGLDSIGQSLGIAVHAVTLLEQENKK